jgi:hypothetical protein
MARSQYPFFNTEKSLTFAPRTIADAGNYGNTINTGWVALDPGSGGTFGAKLMFSNVDTSGYTVYGLGLRCRTYYAGAVGIALNVSGSSAVIASGTVIGGQFFLQALTPYTILSTNATGSAENTALYAKTVLTCAVDPIASCLWIDDLSTVKATVQYMMDITMNGSIQLTDVFHIYGGDPGAANLFDFDTCNQGSGAFIKADATAFSGLTASFSVKCLVNGTPAYIHMTTA